MSHVRFKLENIFLFFFLPRCGHLELFVAIFSEFPKNTSGLCRHKPDIIFSNRKLSFVIVEKTFVLSAMPSRPTFMICYYQSLIYLI